VAIAKPAESRENQTDFSMAALIGQSANQARGEVEAKVFSQAADIPSVARQWRLAATKGQ